jgi:hypothetical protein
VKSLIERQRDREAAEKKERMKRSPGPYGYTTVRIPNYGAPMIETDGDREFIKNKANELLGLIRSVAPWQFLQHIKDDLFEEKRKQDETTARIVAEREARRSQPPREPMPVIPVPANAFIAEPVISSENSFINDSLVQRAVDTITDGGRITFDRPISVPAPPDNRPELTNDSSNDSSALDEVIERLGEEFNTSPIVRMGRRSIVRRSRRVRR